MHTCCSPSLVVIAVELNFDRQGKSVSLSPAPKQACGTTVRWMNGTTFVMSLLNVDECVEIPSLIAAM